MNMFIIVIVILINIMIFIIIELVIISNSTTTNVVHLWCVRVACSGWFLMLSYSFMLACSGIVVLMCVV